MTQALPIIFSFLIGFTYYFSNQFSLPKRRFGKVLTSFSAGVSIVYLLLELFPRFTENALQIDKLVFISLPVGFIIHHLIEKEIYMHNHHHQIVKKLNSAERWFSFVYHIVLGIVLVAVFNESSVQAMLLFVTIAAFTFISTLPTIPHKKVGLAILLSSATLIGTLFHMYVWKNIPAALEYTLVGLAIGVLLFTIVRHHVPWGRHGHIGAFSVGFTLYSFLIIVSWYI